MSEILRTVGSYEIKDTDVDAFISSLSQEQQMYREIPQFREQVADKLVEISLFALDGEASNLEAEEEYIQAMTTARRDILSQLAMARLLKGIEVTDEEAKAFYEENKNHFAKGPSASAKHILVDSEDRANEIKSEIEAGTKSFEDAAREYSSCPSSQKGGSLGTFGRGQMVKEFDEAVFGGEIGKVLGPVKTQFGYHIIFIDERNEGEIPDYEVVKGSVKTELLGRKQQEKYDNRLSELKSKYFVK